IEVSHLTKDYGHGRGVFDVSIKVEQGMCYGFLGPNGAGKTTTIRHLMGFSKPQSGSTSILGCDSWNCADELKNAVGYLPGEIAFPKGLTGTEFLDMQMKLRRVKDEAYKNELLERFQLDPSMRVEKMSLGVRRKLAVVTAFLHDPDILILDEPTSGLDPIMQQNFIDFILSEKKRGKTILLSSHIFHEVDACCDRISIIKDGRIVADFVADELKNRSTKIYRISFSDKDSYDAFVCKEYLFHSRNEKKLRARVMIEAAQINRLLTDITPLNVTEFQEIPFTLEDYFMGFYKNDRHFGEVQS
ncbi:MAG: ABC transporter ATP-binding protein, partial [Oscillospiraceae bacterium]|nr:ABC transporter ATP-binding protein [Oscillospiraceae bacterium]